MSDKKILCAINALLTLTLSGCTAKQEPSINVRYTCAADACYLMDQISGSMPSCFLVEDYFNHWKSFFGLSEQDKMYLKQYRLIRNKYIKIIDFPGFGIELQSLAGAQPDNLFAPCPDFIDDPIAFSFFSSDTIEQALQKVANVVLPDELSFIRNFYSYFYTKISTFSLARSEKILQGHIERQNDFLSGMEVAKHLNNIRKFYRSEVYNVEIRIVWRPSDGGFCASCYGPYIIIQLSPNLIPMDQELFMIYVGVVLHEVTHGFSSHMPREQKTLFTKKFMSQCETIANLPTNPSYGLFTFIEEPLVQILSQALFFKIYYPQYFNLDCCAYNHPRSISLLLPVVQKLCNYF